MSVERIIYFWIIVIQVERRQELLDHLLSNGIKAGIHYPKPVHSHPVYKGRLTIARNMNVTEDLTDKIISLPMYPELSLIDVKKITNAVKSFFK